MKTAVFRKANFNSAHRLHNPNWDEKTNTEVFGLCNNPHYHGHIINRFDHKNLNLDTLEFKNLNPTAENIARIIYELLRKKIDLKFELEITLYETPRNFVVYPIH
jgi:6-pyruvoyltetrahydropterin/6-carboxytetrahydropterin synthase